MNIIQAMDDAAVFGPYFQRDSWAAWKAFTGALFGLPLAPAQLVIRADFPAYLDHAWVNGYGGKFFDDALLIQQSKRVNGVLSFGENDVHADFLNIVFRQLSLREAAQNFG